MRAQLEIVLRNGQAVVAGFEDDEAVNAVVERLRVSLRDDTLFSLELNGPAGQVLHYLPAREIVRFAVALHPRPATITS